MSKNWLEVLKDFLSEVLKVIKTCFKWFISVFNSWHKLAAICLACFIWMWLDIKFIEKIETFMLFGIMSILIFDIAKDSN